MVDASILIAFFLREEGWNEFTRHMVRTVSLDHAVKEFYNAVWKAVSIKKKIDSGEALRCVSLFKKYLDKTCS